MTQNMSCNSSYIGSSKKRFEDFAQAQLLQLAQPIHLPDGAGVFDVFFNVKTGTFMKWSDKLPEKARGPPHYVVIPEVSKIKKCLIY